MSERYEIHFVEIGWDEDHVHFLVQRAPIYSPKKIVNTLKSITVIQIFKLHPAVKTLLWGGEFWTSGNYVNTVGLYVNSGHTDNQELEFIDFFVKEEYGFYVPSPLIDCFNDIGSDTTQPNLIHSTIVEIKDISSVQKILDYIFTETYCCNYLLIIDRINKTEINNLKVLLPISFSPTIDLVILNGGDLSIFVVEEFINNTPSINSLQAYNCGLSSLKIINNCTVSLSEKEYTKVPQTNVSTDIFFVNIYFFNEAKKFNPAFYKTIYIDKNLSIKRYASDQLSFGQLFNSNLKKLASSKPFTELWLVHKSMISQCMDCKYKYMCLDQRVPVAKSGNWQYSEECLQFYR